MKKINIIDMFCGGGGESTGLISAAHEYNFDVNISAKLIIKNIIRGIIIAVAIFIVWKIWG